jgi:hypothetical protein
MVAVLSLLAVQGLIGAFDTLYYHEWRARLPSRPRQARDELRLHGVRSVLYSVIFGTLPWMAWQGLWLALLLVIIAAEIVITLADFVVEDRVRAPLGGVFHGERVTHAIMGIIYGAALACFAPSALAWWEMDSGLVARTAEAPALLRWLLTLMAGGVLLSGLRDLVASTALPRASWPWRSLEPAA